MTIQRHLKHPFSDQNTQHTVFQVKEKGSSMLYYNFYVNSTGIMQAWYYVLKSVVQKSKNFQLFQNIISTLWERNTLWKQKFVDVPPL